jgi:hypothetical protein
MRSPDRPRARIIIAELACDSEIDEYYAALAEDQVAWLDVAVDDLLVVDVLQRLAGLARMLDRLLDRQAGVAASPRSAPSTSSITR